MKIKLSCGGKFSSTAKLINGEGLNTVCKSALCPNRAECWGNATATFMILGDVCTRACRFCAVKKGAPLPPEEDEAQRIADIVSKLNLDYAVLTSPTRDDLPDGGARQWADVLIAIREKCPDAKVETLTPDFQMDSAALDAVLNSAPDVFAHNLETVERLQKTVRGKADYATSLGVLKRAAKHGVITKSGIMLGLGETQSEVEKCLEDAFAAGARIISLGQYLSPSKDHFPIARWVAEEEFSHYKAFALALGYADVQSGAFVRSSYKAKESYLAALANIEK